MTLSLIGVGSAANDGTGDPLRSAFQTVNTAITAINNAIDVQTGYTIFKDDSGSAGVYVTSAGDVGVGTSTPRGPLDVSSGDPQEIFIGDGADGLRIGHSGVVTHIAFGGLTAGASCRFEYNRGAGRLDYKEGPNGAETDFLSIDSNGLVGFKTTAPTEVVDVNSDAIRIRSSQTPASASASGDPGMIAWDSSYIYVCVATNTWKRVAISTW